MKRWFALACAAAHMLSAAYAQQVMDGSDKVLPQQFVDALRVAVGAGQRDPYGTELDSLRLKRGPDGKGPMLCGRVNFRNEYGGFDGFLPLSFDPSNGQLLTGNDAATLGC